MSEKEFYCKECGKYYPDLNNYDDDEHCQIMNTEVKLCENCKN